MPVIRNLRQNIYAVIKFDDDNTVTRLKLINKGNGGTTYLLDLVSSRGARIEQQSNGEWLIALAKIRDLLFLAVLEYLKFALP